MGDKEWRFQLPISRLISILFGLLLIGNFVFLIDLSEANGESAAPSAIASVSTDQIEQETSDVPDQTNDASSDTAAPNRLFLQTHWQSGQPFSLQTQPSQTVQTTINDRMHYTFSPANLSGEPVEKLAVTIELTEGVSLTGIHSGWYINPVGPTDLTVTFLTNQTDEAREWASWRGLNNFRPEYAPINDIELAEEESVTSVTFVYAEVPADFRWGHGPGGSPQLDLVTTKIGAGALQLCSVATLSDETTPASKSCAEVTPRSSTTVPNLALWLNSDVTAPVQANDQFRLRGGIEFLDRAAPQDRFTLVLELPHWIDSLNPISPTLPFQQIDRPESSLYYLEVTPEGLAGLQSTGSTLSDTQPSRFDFSFSASVGKTAPSDEQNISLYVISPNDSIRCWGEKGHGQDANDLDRDGDRSEGICRTATPIVSKSEHSVVGYQQIEGALIGGGYAQQRIVLINTGTGPITGLRLENRLPHHSGEQSRFELSMIAPPQLPAGLILSRTDARCEATDGSDCPTAEWDYAQGASPAAYLDNQILNILGHLSEPLLPGESLELSFPLIIRESASSDSNDLGNSSLEWPSIPLTVQTDQGWVQAFTIEAVQRQIKTEDTAQDRPQPPLSIGGSVWIDRSGDGRQQPDEAGLGDVLIQLWRESDATAEPTLVATTLSRPENGIYRFFDVPAGDYYFAYHIPPNHQTVQPDLGDDDLIDSDVLPDKQRTPLFSITEPITNDLSFGLGLTSLPVGTVEGYVSVDQNQNQSLDDAWDAGINQLKAMLYDESGNLIAETMTALDQFGRPGYFHFPFVAANTAYQVVWESNMPFVDQDPDARANGLYQHAAEAITLSPGEVIQLNVQIAAGEKGTDSGDAPNFYGEATHLIDSGTTLGLISDQNMVAVDDPLQEGRGDDFSDKNDDDGIFFLDNGIGAVAQKENEVVVIVRNQGDSGEAKQDQMLNGWIDFNADGRFEEKEQIIHNYPVSPHHNPQAHTFLYDIPSGAHCGPTFARFRLGEQQSGPAGFAGVGEVEDFPYQIDCIADLAVRVNTFPNQVGQNELLNWYISVENEGPSIAWDVVLASTIPEDLIYHGHVSMTNDPVECNDQVSINFTRTVRCTMPLLKPGQAITVNLATIVPFDYEEKRVVTTVAAGTSTKEKVMHQNFSRAAVTVEKEWVLGPLNLFTFSHVNFYDRLIDNPELREQDFKIDEEITTHINVPISVAVGLHADARPFITVPGCLENPEEVACNNTNYIEGMLIQESFSVEEISWNEEPVFLPDEPIVTYLNRIADANLSQCGAEGSCVGYQLFRVGKNDIYPYAWNGPADYFYVNFVTSGGREITCPEEVYEERCYIVQDAKPGTYRIDGEVDMIFRFDDRRLSDKPIDVYRTRDFRVVVRVIAPFVEPDR